MIDVIIPFYRTPRTYLLNFLKSLQNQTIHDQLNIILINDDVDRNCIDLFLSEPEFIEIIKTFHSFNIICNTSNKGPGYSRNVGIKQSKSPYIWFMDSDDIIPFENTDIFELCVGLCESNGLDFIITKDSYDGKYEYEVTSEFQNSFILNPPPNYIVQFKAILYKSIFLKANQILFDDRFFYHEEDIFYTKLVILAKRIGLLMKHGYHALSRPGSMLCVTKEITPISLLHSFNHSIIGVLQHQELYIQRNLKSDLNVFIHVYIRNMGFSFSRSQLKALSKEFPVLETLQYYYCRLIYNILKAIKYDERVWRETPITSSIYDKFVDPGLSNFGYKFLDINYVEKYIIPKWEYKLNKDRYSNLVLQDCPWNKKEIFGKFLF